MSYRWLLTSIKVLGVCLASLVGLELAVRALGLAPNPPKLFQWVVEDPILPWRPPPNWQSEGWNATGEYHYKVKHNSQGFWDEEHPTEKSEKVVRILGIGDSFTYGAGASFEQTYLARLETMLNERDGSQLKVEVVKAGVGRFWTRPERLLLEHYGLAMNPDLVIVLFVPNDVCDTVVGVDGLAVSDGYLIHAKARSMGSMGVWLAKKLDTFRILARRAQQATTPPVEWREIYRPNGKYEDAWLEILHEFELMQQLTQPLGTTLVLAHIPQGGDFLSSLTPGERAYPGKRIGSWAKERDIPFIDAGPVFEQGSSDALFWPKDGHPTPEGYRLLAETVFEALIEQSLLP